MKHNFKSWSTSIVYDYVGLYCDQNRDPVATFLKLLRNFQK